jgi:hypothetical protein
MLGKGATSCPVYGNIAGKDEFENIWQKPRSDSSLSEAFFVSLIDKIQHSHKSLKP